MHTLSELKALASQALLTEHDARNMQACIQGCNECLRSASTYDPEYADMIAEALVKLTAYIENLYQLAHRVRDA